MAVGRVNAVKTHCKHGHPFAGDNLIVRKSGGRKCRVCGSLQKKLRRDPQRELSTLGMDARRGATYGGVPGVSPSKCGWYAYIDRNGKRSQLGHFNDFAQAVAARKAAESALVAA